jgi:hypothetical protein
MNFKRLAPTTNLFQIIAASIIMLAVTLMLTGCGNGNLNPVASVIPVSLAPVGTQDSNGIFIKSRAAITLYGDTPSLAAVMMKNLLPSAYALTGAQGVTVVNSGSSTMTLDATAFLLPKISNAALNFGSLAVTNLFDNSLSVCGSKANQKCGNAVIQMYTTGQAGAGLWNSVEGYGVPVNAQLDSGSTVQTLNTDASKTIVQSYSIPTNVRTLRQSNFANALKYNVTSDFTNAGSGSFTTTIVVEYGLTL